MRNLYKIAVAGATLVSLSVAPIAQAATRTVNVSMTDTGFVPTTILTLINQPIQVQVTNRGTKVHQYSIPYYHIYTENLSPGRSSTIVFSPWTAGQFQMMSDPSGQNIPEFSGTFMVTESK